MNIRYKKKVIRIGRCVRIIITQRTENVHRFHEKKKK